MEDFTRLTLLIPAAAAHAVKVGTAVRVNGTPLLVASVGGGRNGADVTASFGVSMASHATRDLTAGLYADATVSVEIKDAFAGAMDLATPRESEREGDGLPGSAQWYSNTLPWYSTVYPAANPGAVEAGPAGGERVDYGKNMTDYERYTLEQSRKWSQSQSRGKRKTTPLGRRLRRPLIFLLLPPPPPPPPPPPRNPRLLHHHLRLHLLQRT